MLAMNGALGDMIGAGARILECCLRPLHWHGSIPQQRRRLPAYL